MTREQLLALDDEFLGELNHLTESIAFSRAIFDGQNPMEAADSAKNIQVVDD